MNNFYIIFTRQFYTIDNFHYIIIIFTQAVFV